MLGVDSGGSSTRVLLATTDGVRLATARAGGTNPGTHPPHHVTAQLAGALSEALRGIEPGQVGSAVLAVAGAGRLAADRPARDAVGRAWAMAGLTCRYVVIPDFVAAFAAGTAATDGTVLVAGTGAIAADLHDHTPVRTADGHGWQLGDDGSGYWLGRLALRATLAGLDRGRPMSGLSRRLCARALAGTAQAPAPAELARQLVHRFAGTAPAEIADLAPVVLDAAAEHDPEATALLDHAARLLCDTLAVVRPPSDRRPAVLAGGLMHPGTPLADRVRRRAEATWPGTLVHGTDGAAGAAWLALRDRPGLDDRGRAAVRSRLFSAPATSVPRSG